MKKEATDRSKEFAKAYYKQLDKDISKEEFDKIYDQYMEKYDFLSEDIMVAVYNMWLYDHGKIKKLNNNVLQYKWLLE